MKCLVCGSSNKPRRPRVHGERPGFTCVRCLAENFETADGSWAHAPYRAIDERWPSGKRTKGPAERRHEEHAFADDTALCGIPEDSIILYRHLWSPSAAASCADCATSAQEADERWPADRR